MPIPDDERFELHLKQFRPLAPEPLPASGSRGPSRRRLALWVAAAAAVVILAGAAVRRIHTERVRVAGTANPPAAADRSMDGQPLTMRSANALIATAPSFKALADDLAFRSQTAPIPKGKRSAVDVLSKEKIKL